MTKSKLLICSAVLLTALLGFSKTTFAYDDQYLKGRAIQLANFSTDDLVVEPVLVYNSVSNKTDLPDLFAKNEKVVNLIDPKFSPLAISAVFSAPKYQITDGKKTYEIHSFKRRVGDILTDGGVDLAKEDIVSPNADTLEPVVKASGGNAIKITRVDVAQIEEFEPVPYQTKKTDDPTINKGVEKITQHTEAGIRHQLPHQTGNCWCDHQRQD